MWQIVSSFSTRHAGLVSNEKMFHATDEEIPQRKGPSLSHELRVWEGRRRMLRAATSSKFYGRKPASVAYACQLLSRFFLKKNTGSHTLFCWAIKLSAQWSSSATEAHHHPSVAYPCQTYHAIACGSQNRIQCWSRCLKAEAVAEKRPIGP